MDWRAPRATFSHLPAHVSNADDARFPYSGMRGRDVVEGGRGKKGIMRHSDAALRIATGMGKTRDSIISVHYSEIR